MLRRPRGGGLLGSAADLADDDERLGLQVRGEQLEHVEEGRADDRVAADADARRLAQAGTSKLIYYFIG